MDGRLLDQHSFGGICGASAPLPRDFAPSPYYAHLNASNASLTLDSPGTHEIRFLVARGGVLSGAADYLDDVVLTGSAAVKPVIGNPATAPKRPVAGKRLLVSFPVSRSDDGAPLRTATMTCNPSLGSRVLRHTESFANGIARLSLVVPKTARGRSLKVVITVTADNGLSTTRAPMLRVP